VAERVTVASDRGLTFGASGGTITMSPGPARNVSSPDSKVTSPSITTQVSS
jgi:hypothetical protein